MRPGPQPCFQRCPSRAPEDYTVGVNAIPPVDTLDAGDVRRRVLATIEQARRHAAERRAALDIANERWPSFLDEVAAPVFRQFAQAIKAEGYSFSVHTPARLLRLVSDKSADEFIEIGLETSSGPVQAIGRAQHSRGRRVNAVERPVREDVPVTALTARDVLEFLLDVFPPFVER